MSLPHTDQRSSSSRVALIADIRPVVQEAFATRGTGDRMLRKTGAFLLAPFPAALLQSIVVGLWPKKGMGVFEHPASMFVTICLLFYVFGLVIGIPLFLLLRKRIVTLRDHALAGMAIVVLPVVAAMSWAAFKGEVSMYVAVYDLAFFAIGGALAGAVFRLLTRPGRSAEIGEMLSTKD